MLDKNQIAAASQTLHDHWRAGTKLAALDDWMRPHNRAEGYAIQAAIERYSTTHLFGWKIAATSEAGQKHINVAGPMAGRILRRNGDRRRRHGLDGRQRRCASAEPEFAFRMETRSAAALDALHACEQVLDAVDTLHPAIEIPDSRFADFVSAGEAQLIADNACAHLFVLGPATTANWRAMDLVEERPRDHAARPAISSATARTCSAIPASPWPGSPTNCAGSASPCRQGRS